MKRIILLVSVVLVMAAMMVILAGTAMAHAPNAPCPNPGSGTATAHGTVTNPTAHHAIPCPPQ